MKKILKISFLFVLSSLVAPPTTLAVCPVCTVAVGAGVGLSRFLGIDDTISGAWVGGLILSLGLWLANFLENKNIKFKYLTSFSVLIMYLVTILPLWWSGILGHPLNKIFGIDKLVFGIFVGSISFGIGTYLDQLIRKRRGKQLFIYQKVIFPVVILIIASTILFFITSVKIN